MPASFIFSCRKYWTYTHSTKSTACWLIENLRSDLSYVEPTLLHVLAAMLHSFMTAPMLSRRYLFYLMKATDASCGDAILGMPGTCFRSDSKD